MPAKLGAALFLFAAFFIVLAVTLAALGLPK